MAAFAGDRKAASRHLYEGGEVTLEALAGTSGYSVRTMAKWAKTEGWRKPAQAAESLDRVGRINRLADHLIGEIETIGEPGGEASWDKTRIDAVSALTRALEKIGEITRDDGRAKENQTRRDEEMADVLRRIDERIVELATEYARRMGTAEPDAGAGGAGS